MKIIIDSNETLAADVANIISAADKSFAQFARPRVGGAKPPDQLSPAPCSDFSGQHDIDE